MMLRAPLAGGLLAALALTACSSGSHQASTPAPSTTAAVPAPATSAAGPAATANSPLPASTATPVQAGPGTLAATPLAVPSSLATGTFATTRTLQAPKGSSVALYAAIPGARFIVTTPQHGLLVSVPSTGDLVLLTPQADPAAQPTQTTLATGIDSPQGMAFDTLDGRQVLYVAGTTTLVRYVWNATTLGARTTILTGLPGGENGYAHPLKEVVIAADHTVYLDLASASNDDPANRAAGEAEIVKVPAGGTTMSTVMTGVRNGDGLSFDPTGRLWTAVNMRDNITDPTTGAVSQGYVNDHPPDEIVTVTQGRDLGWPYCDPDQTLSADQSDPYGTVPLRNDHETDAAGTVDCAKLPAVERGIPAHSAPLGFHFLEGSSLPSNYAGGAVLATHGSNDHVPPRAAELFWLPYDAEGKSLGAEQPFLAGFTDSSGNRWGKPTDAAAGADGSLYVTDDTAGGVYRLTFASVAASKA